MGTNAIAMIYSQILWIDQLMVFVNQCHIIINAAFPIFMLLPFVPYLLELDTNGHAKNFNNNVLTCFVLHNYVWCGNK